MAQQVARADDLGTQMVGLLPGVVVSLASTHVPWLVRAQKQTSKSNDNNKKLCVVAHAFSAGISVSLWSGWSPQQVQERGKRDGF